MNTFEQSGSWISPLTQEIVNGKDYYITILIDGKVQSWLLVKGGKRFAITLTTEQPEIQS